VVDLGGDALGAIDSIPKNFCSYFPAEKVQKWVDITSDGRQIALFDLDRTNSSPNRTPLKKILDPPLLFNCQIDQCFYPIFR
jgi:hypothetical protein